MEPHEGVVEKHVMLRKYSRLKLVGILALIVTGIVAVGAHWVNGRLSGVPQQGYETATAQKCDMSAVVQATGIVKAMVGAEVKVGARTSGKVVRLPFNVGDKVKKGQVIGVIEQDDLAAKVKYQKALVAEARAEEKRYAKDLERYRQLIQTQSVSPQKLDEYEAQFEMARARTLKHEAELEYQESQLAYATIFSPIDGTVASVNTIEGETVAASTETPTFVKIVNLDHLEVRAYVDENDIGRVEIGQDATFTVAAFPSTEFQGTVTSIYPSATTQDNVVYYLTTISVDNREGKLRPEMTSNVSIFVDRRMGVVTVPHKAVKRDRTQKFVLVLKNGTLEKRFVKGGLRDRLSVEILDGLREGELVVIGEPGRK